MSSDSVSTTAPEGRKSTKPIMEKRRRARINACLAELKSLLMDVIKAEGARHSKMEKADILEMTVRHLRQLQRQTIAGFRPQEQTTQSKYRMGYLECINEVGRFLSSLEIDDIDLRTKIIEHLANCVAGARIETAETEVSTPPDIGITHAPILIRPRPEKPVTSLTHRDDNCLQVTNPNSVIDLTNPQMAKVANLENLSNSVTDETSSVINLSNSSPLRLSGLLPSQIPKSNIGSAKMNEGYEGSNDPQCLRNDKQWASVLCADKYPVCDLQPKPLLMAQAGANVKLTGTPSATTINSPSTTQIFRGLQLLPTQMPSGEIVFVVPASIVPANQPSSYVIPILSQNTLTSSTLNPISVTQPVLSTSSNGAPSFGYNMVSLKSAEAVSAKSEVSNLQINDAKSVIATCADVSSALKINCDLKQSDVSKAKTSELLLPNQNILYPPLAHNSGPQSFIPTQFTCTNVSVGNLHTNVCAVSQGPTVYQNLVNELSSPNKNLQICKIPMPIPATATYDRNVQSPPNLVLNLAMQNRTRAGDSEAHRNFQDDDENVWRPW